MLWVPSLHRPVVPIFYHFDSCLLLFDETTSLVCHQSNVWDMIQKI